MTFGLACLYGHQVASFEYHPMNVGLGITYALPIVCSACLANDEREIIPERGVSTDQRRKGRSPRCLDAISAGRLSVSGEQGFHLDPHSAHSSPFYSQFEEDVDLSTAAKESSRLGRGRSPDLKLDSEEFIPTGME